MKFTGCIKGAVSFRFSQGLLNLMCNNSKLRCYSVWGKTPVFHNFGFNSETILPISIFLFDDDTYIASPQNGIWVCQLEPYFLKIFLFCVKYLSFRCFHFLRNLDNFLKRVSKKKREPFWSKRYEFSSQKRIGSLYAIALKLNLDKVDLMLKNEVGEYNDLNWTVWFLTPEKHSFGVHTD